MALGQEGNLYVVDNGGITAATVYRLSPGKLPRVRG
jgi:hypothetical protein